MREILFRGKANNGKWVYGVPVPVTINCYVKGVEIIDEEGIEYDELDGYNPVFGADRVDPETVGQFTGLTDKNGNKIFEGDILVIRNCREHPVLVQFIEFSWQCVIPNVDAYIHYRHGLENNDTKYEVIGNIHDQPELLEG